MPLSQEHPLYALAIGSDSFSNALLFQPQTPSFLKKNIIWFGVFCIFFLLHWPYSSLKNPFQQTTHRSGDRTVPWSTFCALKQYFCSLSPSLLASRGRQHKAAAQGSEVLVVPVEATATPPLSTPAAQPSAVHPFRTHRRFWRGLYPPVLLLFRLTRHCRLKCWGILLCWFAVPPRRFLPGVAPERKKGGHAASWSVSLCPMEESMNAPAGLTVWLRSFPKPVTTMTLYMSTWLANRFRTGYGRLAS